MSRSDPITQALQAGVQEGVFPGAVLLVRLRNTILYHKAVGLTSSLSSSPPSHINTLYDLASLTKPLATTTAFLCMVQDGLVDLDQTAASILPPLTNNPIGEATIRDLLCHRSGLPAWRPFYQQFVLSNGEFPESISSGGRRDSILAAIRQEPLEYQPRTKAIYSDLGFMLLGFVIEKQAKQSLAEYCQERIYSQLAAQPLFFVNNKGLNSSKKKVSLDVAPTEQDPWRGRLLQGEVHDENAYVLNGIAGHAGLFGTAEAVAVMTGAWLDGYWGRHSFFHQQLVTEFVTKQGDSSWALGWDTPSQPSSSGRHFSPESFGHLGFTGTSIWIEPTRALEIILLTNRVHPTRDNNKIREFRPKIHDLVYEEFVGSQ